jgi:hypothetical protein
MLQKSVSKSGAEQRAKSKTATQRASSDTKQDCIDHTKGHSVVLLSLPPHLMCAARTAAFRCSTMHKMPIITETRIPSVAANQEPNHLILHAE